VMTMSENDRCWTVATQQLLCWRHAISDSLSSRLAKTHSSHVLSVDHEQ
jgi:hypothetical protein